MKRYLHFTAGVLATLLALEGIFRLLPTLHGWANPPVTPDFPMVRQFPGAHFTYSLGPYFENHADGRFNNLGYPADDVNLAKTSIAIIGDSFVEAAMIAPSDKVSHRLSEKTGTQVIALGEAGTGLADYTVSANWVSHNAPLKWMIFAVNAGDLTDSLVPPFRGYWYAQVDGKFVLQRRGKFWLRNFLTSSRLFDYLYYNLKIGPQMLFENWKRPDANVLTNEAAAGEPPAKPAELSPLAIAAGRHFMQEARVLQDRGIPVLIMVNASANAIYAGRNDRDPELMMVKRLAGDAGLPVLDLSDVFARDYAVHHRRLTFEVDPHWNAYGHQIVADALWRIFQGMPDRR
jgi:hypothetical protein